MTFRTSSWLEGNAGAARTGKSVIGTISVKQLSELSFMRHHGDLLDAAFWQDHQARIRQGHVHDVFPYEPSRRFRRPEQAAGGLESTGIERRRA